MNVQIHLIEKDQASPPVQRLYDALERQAGSVSNFNKMLAHKPEVLRAFNQLSGAIWAEGALSPTLKELAYLRTSILNGCAY
jgi:alkylhydroperoxidase family enzyme